VLVEKFFEVGADLGILRVDEGSATLLIEFEGLIE